MMKFAINTKSLMTSSMWDDVIQNEGTVYCDIVDGGIIETRFFF